MGQNAAPRLATTADAPPNALKITSSAGLPQGTTGAPYAQQLGVSGGNPPYSWGLMYGALPDGLTLTREGAVTGTPEATGTTSFTAQVSDTSGAAISESFTISVAGGSTVTTLSAASWTGPTVADNMLLASIGSNLSSSTVAAEASPWPTTLGGVTVSVTDSRGKSGLAQLNFVSPGQINWLMPDWPAAGPATVTVANSDGTQFTGTVQVAAVAPGLFTANSSGSGVAAAAAVSMDASGNQIVLPVLQCGTAPLSCAAVHMTAASGQNLIVLLFGTGIRGYTTISARSGTTSLPVLGAAAQATYAGLDQVNIQIPSSLAGAGEIPVVLTIDGHETNQVLLAVGPVAPRISAVQPASIQRGQRTRVTFTGANLGTVWGLAAYPPDGVAATGVAAAADSVSMDITVDSSAALGSRMVAVTNPQGRSDVLPLTIMDPTPQIASLNPTSGTAGKTIQLTISGQGLGSVTAVNFSPAAGMTVTNVAATGAQVTATVAIASSATLGSYNVTVSAPAGISNALPFTVQAPAPAPAITSLSPSSGAVGQLVTLAIAGSNLAGVTSVNFSPSSGIRIRNVSANSGSVFAAVFIGVSTTAGSYSVTVSGPAGTSNSLPFTVIAPPSITTLSPSSGAAGQTVNLTIAGSNLTGVTSVSFSPSSGISISNISTTATQVTARVAIDASASGSYSVTVTGPGGASNQLTFQVTTPGPSYDGTWRGATSQNQSILFTVQNNTLNGFTIDVQFHFASSNCPTGATIENVRSAAISGNQFTLSGLSGAFNSATSASGSYKWSVNIPGCVDSGTVQWSAYKGQ